MSGWMGALGGIGEAGMLIGMQNMKDWAAQDLAKQRDDAESERQKSLIRLKMELDQQQKDAPLARLGEKSKEFSQQEVPVQAEAVKALIGPMSDGNGGERIGMKGDIESLKKRVESLPEADRQPYLDQLKSQQAQDQAKAQDAVAGQTRKMTGEESLAKAVEWARANDLPAVAAYEAQIGKPMREERRLESAERRDDSRIDLEKSRIETERARTILMDKKLDGQESAQQRREERQDKFMELQEQRLKASSDKAEVQSQRAGVTALMTSTERELERTMTLAKDPMLSDAEKKMFEARANSLTKDLGRYKKGLESFTGDSIPSPSNEPAKMQDVKVGDKVIGQAATPEEARKLVDEWKSSKGGTKPVKADAPLIERPAYIPPADSPAGRALADRAAKAGAEYQSKEAAKSAEATKSEAATSAAMRAIEAKDPQEAERVQSMPGYSLMDASTKAALFKIINGR